MVDIVEKTQRYSCFTCHTHFELDVAIKENGRRCPECGEKFIHKRCAADPERGCHCPLHVNPGVKYCDTCGQPVCPTCGDHDVSQVSRVTGYLSDVAGWNASKRQELKDRNRYNIT